MKLREQAIFFPEDHITFGNEKFCEYIFRLRDNQIPYYVVPDHYEYMGKKYQRKRVYVEKRYIRKYKIKFPDRLGWLWEN